MNLKDIKISIDSYKANVIESCLENYNIEFKSKDLSEANLEKDIREIKIEICNQQCNIALWDDKKYYYLEKRFNLDVDKCSYELDDAQQLRDCIERMNRKYYPKIKKHYLANLDFDQSDFIYLPYNNEGY